MGRYKADRWLYLTLDKSRVVEEGDPEARFLLLAPGHEMLERDAERYGLLAAKAVEKPADKSASKPKVK